MLKRWLFKFSIPSLLQNSFLKKNLLSYQIFLLLIWLHSLERVWPMKLRGVICHSGESNAQINTLLLPYLSLLIWPGTHFVLTWIQRISLLVITFSLDILCMWHLFKGLDIGGFLPISLSHSAKSPQGVSTFLLNQPAS